MIAATLIVVLIFAISGGALFAALIMSRRGRLELERRVALAVGTRGGGRIAIDAWLRAQSPAFDPRVHHFFTAGRGQTWGMKSGATRLLFIAAVAGFIVWLLTFIAFGWSLWLAVPLTLAAAYGTPRIMLLRQQRDAERQFTDLFPDAVVAMARMLRAGLPITTAVRAISKESPPPVSTVFVDLSIHLVIGSQIDVAFFVSRRCFVLRFFILVYY